MQLSKNLQTLLVFSFASVRTNNRKPNMTAEELGQMIWNVKELLRNIYDNKDVEDVILPFTLLRRLDCVLVGSESLVATNMKQLEELGQTSQEDIDNMMPMLMDAAGYKFYNTSGLSLSKLITVPADLTNNFKTYLEGFSPNIREILKNFTGKGENASLSDIFLNLARKNLLLQVTKAFVLNIDLSPDKVDNHMMGTVFEIVIRYAKESVGIGAGQFYTPRDIVRLMTEITLLGQEDKIYQDGKIISVYDPCCGTGGILTLTKDTIEETAKERRVDVTVNLFGQELNDKTYALCKSDIIMKGDEAKGIAVGDTLLIDEFRDQKFNFMLANPPYGVDWKREYDSVSAEAEDKNSRFAPGLPDKSDGQLLFTLHMLHKMDPKGSRVGILSNGSPLFNGGAGSGWSNIRKHMLDNDLLDAIIALPGGLFYGTGIATYLWIFDNKKPESHKNKVLLINAAKDEYVQPMRKNLGMKNVLVSDYGRNEICRIYHAFETCDNAKLMDKDDFFYTYITVERPLRLIYKDVKTKYAALDEKKQSETLANIVALDDIDTERTDTEFFAYLESKKVKITAKLIKDCRTFFGEVAETAPEVHVIPLDDSSDLVADTNLRDYESIPFKTDIQEYFQNEVLRFAPDAWMDREKDKIGCEFPISKLFYEYQPLRSVEDILADIRALEEDEEQSIQSLIND